MNTSDPTTHPSKALATRNLVIGAVVIAVLLILGVYLWGNVQTRSQLDAQKTEYEQRIAQMDSQMQATQGQLGSARNRNLLLMARADLYRAATALDQRNFGIANTHLRQVARSLAGVDAASAGLDTNRLAELRASIEAMNINVATNLQEQRNQVLDLASQLDAMAADTSGEAAAQ